MTLRLAFFVFALGALMAVSGLSSDSAPDARLPGAPRTAP